MHWIAPAEKDATDQFRANSGLSDEDFKSQLETLNEELETLNAQARTLEQTIASNIAGILKS